MRRFLPVGVCLSAIVLGDAVAAPAERVVGTTEIDRAAYAEHLRGFWLAALIANWTGLQTEAARTGAAGSSFYTDDDWGVVNGRFGFPIRFIDDPAFVNSPGVWPADDDTDIEYIYLDAMASQQGVVLSGAAIRDAWTSHIAVEENNYLWVSNQQAFDRMGEGVIPPGTSLPGANSHWLMIDAQLTTEIFGALAPGMPIAALESAEPAIRTTARGHAMHASEYFVLLHALAPIAPTDLPPDERVMWLSEQARKHIPDSSKAADIIDAVTELHAEARATGTLDDWEAARDAVYQRYQVNAGANGFVYRAWYESSVNLASGVIALLYGGGDLRETIRIGTLTGWDCDNPTASVGGALGLMLGEAGVQAAFPAATVNLYDISRTRIGFDDLRPDHPVAEDDFNAMTARMLAVIDRVVIAAGGSVDANAWTIPAYDDSEPKVDVVSRTPGVRIAARSATATVLAAEGPATGSVVFTPASVVPGGGASANPALFADGWEHDATGREPPRSIEARTYASRVTSGGPATGVTLRVTYDQPVCIDAVRLIEGEHASDGGWFTDASVMLRVNGTWQPATATPSVALDSAVAFQTIDFALTGPVEVTGVAITGTPGGPAAYVTACEVDGLVAGGGEPCSVADTVLPYGTLNFADVQAFLGAFSLGEPAADLADPAGVFNFADVQAFLAAFGIGC